MKKIDVRGLKVVPLKVVGGQYVGTMVTDKGKVVESTALLYNGPLDAYKAMKNLIELAAAASE